MAPPELAPPFDGFPSDVCGRADCGVRVILLDLVELTNPCIDRALFRAVSAVVLGLPEFPTVFFFPFLIVDSLLVLRKDKGGIIGFSFPVFLGDDELEETMRGDLFREDLGDADAMLLLDGERRERLILLLRLLRMDERPLFVELLNGEACCC